MITIFIQIPKTAGTSFNTFLSRSFGARKTLHISADQVKDPGAVWLAISHLERSRIELIRGHFSYGLHEHMGEPARYVTVLRRPVERIVSHLNHLASEAALYPEVQSRPFQMARRWSSLDQAVAEFPLPVFDNMMVRMLSGANPPYGLCSDEHLEKAKKNLDTFASIGLQEHLQESICLIRQDLKLRALPLISRQKGGNPKIINLSAIEQDKLLGMNAYDAALYAYAEKQFKDRLSKAQNVVQLASFARSLTPMFTTIEILARRIRPAKNKAEKANRSN